MRKIYKPCSWAELNKLVQDESVCLGDIDTSLITDMSYLFRDSERENFDGLGNVGHLERDNDGTDVLSGEVFQPSYRALERFVRNEHGVDVWRLQQLQSAAGAWNVSKVRNISAMFCDAVRFNQPLDTWDTSGVCDMAFAFANCREFDQNIDSWDTSNVMSMEGMFMGAARFNQPLNSWQTGKVRLTRCMFEGAKNFNQPLDKWDMSHVESTERMFKNARSFNQPLDMWLIPRFCDVDNMFLKASSFTDVKTLALCFYLAAKKKYQENLKETLNSFDAADVYAELSRYDSKQTKEYKCELEALHPELRGSVPAVAVTRNTGPVPNASL